jgi:hypothetical protein
MFPTLTTIVRDRALLDVEMKRRMTIEATRFMPAIDVPATQKI